MGALGDPIVLDDRTSGRGDGDDHVCAAHDLFEVRRSPDLEPFVLGLLAAHEVVEGLLRAAPEAHVLPTEVLVAGREDSFRHVSGADDGEHLAVLTRQVLRGDRRRGTGAHHGVVATVAYGEREPGLGVGVNEDREDGRQIEPGAVLLADGDPLAGGRLGIFYVGGHHLPLARVLVEHYVALRLHVVAALAVHAVGVLDARVVLVGPQQTHHIRAAEYEGLAVPPTLQLSSFPRPYSLDSKGASLIGLSGSRGRRHGLLGGLSTSTLRPSPSSSPGKTRRPLWVRCRRTWPGCRPGWPRAVPAPGRPRTRAARASGSRTAGGLRRSPGCSRSSSRRT